MLVNRCSPAVSCTRDAQGRPPPQGFGKISLASFGGPDSEGFAFLKHRVIFFFHSASGLVAFPQQSTRHSIPNPGVVLSALPAPWTCLGSGFLTPSKARPVSPNPITGARLPKPSTTSAGSLESGDTGYVKALVCSFFSWVTALGRALFYVDCDFS